MAMKKGGKVSFPPFSIHAVNHRIDVTPDAELADSASGLDLFRNPSQGSREHLEGDAAQSEFGVPPKVKSPFWASIVILSPSANSPPRIALASSF